MSSPPTKQVLVVRRDLKVRRGKEVSQGGHAAAAWLAAMVTEALQPDGIATIRLDPAAVAWLLGSFRKITVYVNTEAELLALHAEAERRGLRSRLIRDAGLTEFRGVRTVTMLAIGPDWDEAVDAVTAGLPLY